MRPLAAVVLSALLAGSSVDAGAKIISVSNWSQLSTSLKGRKRVKLPAIQPNSSYSGRTLPLLLGWPDAKSLAAIRAMPTPGCSKRDGAVWPYWRRLPRGWSRYAHAAFVVTSGFPNNTREDFESADPKVILGVVRYYDPRTFQPPREVLAFWDKKGDPLELDLNDPRVRAEGLGARAVDQRLWALEMAGIALDAGAPIPVRLQAACLFKREAIALRRLGAEFQDDAQERRFLTEQSERGVSGIGWLLALSGAYEVSVVAPKLAAAGLSGLAESLGGRGLFQFLLSPRGPALVLSSGGVVPLTAAQARLLALVAGVTLAIPAGSPLMMQAVKKAYQDMPNLSKLADKALADSRTKAEADQLLDKFRRGNNNPGKGTKALCAGVSYLRGNYGARVFFRMTSAGIEVLGIASKKVGGLEDKVIAAIRDRYCRGGNN